MVAVATVPIIRAVQTTSTTQAWFADDVASSGHLLRLHYWWDSLVQLGPKYGYFPNTLKTRLLVKPDKMTEAEEIFADTAVRISAEGKHYLGGAHGSDSFRNESFRMQIIDWVAEVQYLAKFARTEPQAAFAAFTHGLISK